MMVAPAHHHYDATGDTPCNGDGSHCTDDRCRWAVEAGLTPLCPAVRTDVRVCDPCKADEHSLCFDGERAREKFEAEAFFDGPVPYWRCECDCEGGTVGPLPDE